MQLCLSKILALWFYQHRGIEIGTSTSVMVANITV